MKNDAIVESIQTLVTEYKKLTSTSSKNKEDLGSLRYLLLQSIRQYDIPLSHRYVSEAAFKLWNQLTSQSIKDCHYRDRITCDKLNGSINCSKYKGAYGTGNPTTLTTNSTFLFREMFHEDHVIPVSVILDKMSQCSNVNKTSIKCLLDKMYLCVILKEEDRRIGRTKGRNNDDFQTIIDTVYKNNGITLYQKPFSLIQP